MFIIPIDFVDRGRIIHDRQLYSQAQISANPIPYIKYQLKTGTNHIKIDRKPNYTNVIGKRMDLKDFTEFFFIDNTPEFKFQFLQL